MRPIYLARLDKTRPVLLLTREHAVDRLVRVTVAPITSRVRGLASEVPLGRTNGLDTECAVSIDNVLTISKDLLGRQVGWLLDSEEEALAKAIAFAYDLTKI